MKAGQIPNIKRVSAFSWHLFKVLFGSNLPTNACPRTLLWDNFSKEEWELHAPCASLKEGLFWPCEYYAQDRRSQLKLKIRIISPQRKHTEVRSPCCTKID